jgi:hypothetical protein
MMRLFFKSILPLLFILIQFSLIAQDYIVDQIPEINHQEGDLPLYGVYYEMDQSLALESQSKNGMFLNKRKIHLNHASGCILLVKNLHLKAGDSLQIFNKGTLYRYFTALNISTVGTLNSGIIPFKEFEIRLKTSEVQSVKVLDLDGLVLFHEEDLKELRYNHAEKDFGESDNCNININCTEGTKLQTEKRGISRVLVVVEEGVGWCSSSLINNTSEDYRPYTLTAFHCQNGYTPLFDFWAFDFNYEYSDCFGGLDEPGSDMLTGCSYIAGREASDFMLLELSRSVPLSYRAFWNGWNRSQNSPTEISMAHHPKGDIKKVTLYDDESEIRTNASPLNWEDGVVTPANHHWRAAHTSGMFEPGSSGAPALDDNGLIVGQLHGGIIDCNNGVSYFGKLDRSWGDGGSNDERLEPWLSPDRTNPEFLPGLASRNTYCSGQTHFTDTSGLITDGSSLDEYMPNTNCEFLISLSDTNYIIELSFTDIDLGTGDSIIIYDGGAPNAPILSKLSANSVVDPKILSNSQEVLIQFKADGENQKRGFQLYYARKLIDREITIQGFVPSTFGNQSIVVNVYDGHFLLIDSMNVTGQDKYSVRLPKNSGRYFIEMKVFAPNAREGITNFDLIYLRQMLLKQRNPLDIFEFIAADVNQNGAIDLRDLILLRGVLVRILDAWPASESSIVAYSSEKIKACEEFEWSSCATDPFNKFIEIDSSEEPSQDLDSYSFYTIILGDVNGSGG